MKLVNSRYLGRNDIIFFMSFQKILITEFMLTAVHVHRKDFSICPLPVLLIPKVRDY